MKPYSLHIDVSTSIEEVQLIFETHSLSALPVCEGDNFIGVLRQEIIADALDEETIAVYRYALEHFYVPLTATWDAVIEAFATYHTDMLPVINEAEQFIGYYHLPDFVQQLSQTPFVQEAGRVLILEKNAHHYSFAEVSRIVEENGGKLLGLYLSNRTDNEVHITLKLIINDLSQLLQLFRRYGYGILTEKDDDLYRQELKDISQYFEKYINI